ncbi:MAG TPA: MFS transporter [Rhizomicrobium sp.]|jgi:Na+/melibiose symporter-like transporter|nr:MFS transporter [Rhizomicrobium sp.]
MSTTTVDRSELSSLRAKLFYGSGSIAFGVKDFAFGTLLLFYYNQVIGLPVAWVSGAIAFVLIFDAFADPIVGQFSDNLRTKWGRRHPLMYASALPVAISFFFLWIPPDWSHEALFYYLIVMAILVRTFITMYEIPSSAMVPEMTTDYDERTKFLSYRYFFGIMAGVVMSFLTYRYLLYPDATHAIAQLNPAGYPRFALACSIVMLASILIASAGTHRYIPYFIVPEQRRITLSETFREMRTSLMHKQFVILVVAAIFGTVAIGVGSALMLYFNTYFWGLSTTQISLFAFTGIGGAFIAPFIAPLLSRQLGKRNAALSFYFLCVVMMVLPVSLRLIGFFPANGTSLLVGLLFAERVTASVLGIGCLILFSSMMADVVEDSAVKTGRRSEGLFFSSMAFIAKALSGAGTLFAGWILSGIGFPDHASPATIDPTIVRNLGLIYVPVIAGFYGVGILCLSRYRISKSQHEENVRILNEASIEMVTPVAVAPPAQ